MDKLQDRISRGLGAAARVMGARTDAYRASGVDDPLASPNRFLRLNATFSAADAKFTHPSGYGTGLWQGIFDSAYTRVGDYLVQETGTWFIASQERLLPILCVRVNRVVSLARAAAPASNGVNAYGGVTLANVTPLLTNWPASVLGVGGSGRAAAGLPSDSVVPFWTVLLPAFPGVLLRPADILTDDIGRTASVSAAELTDLGWRLTVKQATT
jgi:hypothetical protein